MVLYNRENEGNAVDSVDCEHAAAGRTLARRLIGLGHRSFALVTGQRRRSSRSNAPTACATRSRRLD